MIDAVTLPPVSSKSDIRALEATCIRLAEGQRLWRKYTSGTTGPRTSVFYDDKFYFEQLFVCVRKVCALGGYPLRSNDRVLSIMGNTGYADELFVDPCVDDLIYARIGCDERDPVSIQKMWSTLELFAPSVVTVKPSLAEALSLATWCLGLRIPVHRPKIVISSGQSLNHRARAAIDNIFGGRVINALITTEAGLVAGQDREDDAWLVDRSALDVVMPAAGGGALRVTSDANAIMRLSGYFLGDDVELLHDDCGRQRLRMIGGRPAAVATFDSGLVIDLSRFDHVAFELIGANDYRLVCWPDQVL